MVKRGSRNLCKNESKRCPDLRKCILSGPIWALSGPFGTWAHFRGLIWAHLGPGPIQPSSQIEAHLTIRPDRGSFNQTARYMVWGVWTFHDCVNAFVCYIYPKTYVGKKCPRSVRGPPKVIQGPPQDHPMPSRTPLGPRRGPNKLHRGPEERQLP